MIIEVEERIAPGTLWEFNGPNHDHHDLQLVEPELGIQPGELVMISSLRPGGPFISKGDHLVVIEPFVEDTGKCIKVTIDVVINARGGTKRLRFGQVEGLPYMGTARGAKDWLIRRWDWLFDRLD